MTLETPKKCYSDIPIDLPIDHGWKKNPSLTQLITCITVVGELLETWAGKIAVKEAGN